MMDAAEVKHRLRARHPGFGGQMPGPWTVIEEWQGIDLLAFAAWSSHHYERIGYEVKVSRGDLRRELLRPDKREKNVAWCNRFYFAVPKGLLTDEELAYVEPEWQPEDWTGERCPGFGGRRCERSWSGYDHQSRRRRWRVKLPRPTTARRPEWEHDWVLCPTCNGLGYVTRSRVELEAPTCWVPRDVGLVVVDGNGTHEVKRSPRRKDVPALSPAALNKLVRWVSMRPDDRHHASVAESVA